MSELKFKVIAFDVFGTLIKIGEKRSPYRKLMRWLKDNGRKPNISDALTIMSTNGDLEDICKNFGTQIPVELLEEINLSLELELEAIEPYEDSVQILESLKNAGYLIVLCSNTAQPYGKKVTTLLPRCDLYAWSYEIGKNKPDFEIYDYFVKSLNCSAADVLFIGDTP